MWLISTPPQSCSSTSVHMTVTFSAVFRDQHQRAVWPPAIKISKSRADSEFYRAGEERTISQPKATRSAGRQMPFKNASIEIRSCYIDKANSLATVHDGISDKFFPVRRRMVFAFMITRRIISF